MKTTRRGFLGSLLSVPFVGRILAPAVDVPKEIPAKPEHLVETFESNWPATACSGLWPLQGPTARAIYIDEIETWPDDLIAQLAPEDSPLLGLLRAAPDMPARINDLPSPMRERAIRRWRRSVLRRGRALPVRHDWLDEALS